MITITFGKWVLALGFNYSDNSPCFYSSFAFLPTVRFIWVRVLDRNLYEFRIEFLNLFYSISFKEAAKPEN